MDIQLENISTPHLKILKQLIELEEEVRRVRALEESSSPLWDAGLLEECALMRDKLPYNSEPGRLQWEEAVSETQNDLIEAMKG